VSINTPVLAKKVRFWNITSRNQVSLSCVLAWLLIQDVNPLRTFLWLRWLYQVRTITPPFISSRIGDIVEEEYAQMVDVDKIMLFWLHVAADFMEIKPLLELTSLGILIGYVWVSAFDFWWSYDRLRLNSAIMTWKLGKTSRGYSKSIRLGPGKHQLGLSSLLRSSVNWSELEMLAFATLSLWW
jgi:hypothetical protein